VVKAPLKKFQRGVRALVTTEKMGGLLAKRRVGPQTKERYENLTNQFLSLHALGPRPTPTQADPLLEQELETRFLTGETVTHARYLYYALRWSFRWLDHQLPLGRSALQGYIKETKEVARDPML